MITRTLVFRSKAVRYLTEQRSNAGQNPFQLNAEAGRCAPRPLRARPRLSPQLYDTVCQIKS